MNANQKMLLLDWSRKIHQNEYAHRFQSGHWSTIHYFLGVTSLLGGAIIGALSAFCEFESIYKNVTLSIVGLIVAICSGLLTFLKPQESSERHKNTSSNYEKLRHQIEFLMQFEEDSSNTKSEIENVKKKWDDIDLLNVWEWVYKSSRKKVDSLKKYPEPLGFISDLNGK